MMNFISNFLASIAANKATSQKTSPAPIVVPGKTKLEREKNLSKYLIRNITPYVPEHDPSFDRAAVYLKHGAYAMPEKLDKGANYSGGAKVYVNPQTGAAVKSSKAWNKGRTL